MIAVVIVIPFYGLVVVTIPPSYYAYNPGNKKPCDTEASQGNPHSPGHPSDQATTRRISHRGNKQTLMALKLNRKNKLSVYYPW